MAGTRIVTSDLPIELTEAIWALPGVWQEMSERMQVLEGQWEGYGPRPRERMRFRWVEDEE
ncbi:hypothetical protein [Adonisia turfae]|uniref:hypothetical protein n=1 Tax=Adonisia turfae TaxID=2950184 RepID=UPI0013D6E9FE|nr:hypothetical protein [Adonisia turfae]